MAKSQQAERVEQDPRLARYSRQVLFEGVGEEGQRKLMNSRVALLGCGALGTVLASTVVRAGVGFVRIVDRDFIEENNLQRQILFDEKDIAENLPKAEAARRKLSVINSTVQIEAVVADINYTNIEDLIDGTDLILDGLDNFETRFLINDAACKHNKPWVYGACIGATGLSMPIIPGDTPCLRCVFEQAPPPGMNPTCDTAGVLSPVVNTVASHQAMEAFKILMGRTDALDRKLVSFDLWQNRTVAFQVATARDQGNCVCCKQRRFEFLEGKFGSDTTTLCGRNAVQITQRAVGARFNFEEIAAKVEAVAPGATHNRFMLKFEVNGYHVTVFADGRAIIQGTNKPEIARAVYAKYIGT